MSPAAAFERSRPCESSHKFNACMTLAVLVVPTLPGTCRRPSQYILKKL